MKYTGLRGFYARARNFIQFRAKTDKIYLLFFQKKKKSEGFVCYTDYINLIKKGGNNVKITLDLDTCEIIVPKNFFKNIEKENDIIKKAKGEPVPPVERLKNAFNTAISDTDKYLHVKG